MLRPNAAMMGPDMVPAKRRQILNGAREVFGELGFERASVDLIAARAGVSKATVYNHFEDKKALFVAAVVQDADEMRDRFRACLDCAGDDVEQGLQIIGEQVMHLFLTPSVARLYRHAIAESVRLPEIGRMVFERGTAVLQETIAAHLKRWGERGALRIDDPRAAAIAFLALCQGDLATRSRLGVLEYPVEEQVRETVERGVRTFVRAYAA
jgi:TetR/AcrR family transcriptional repressor of mexJK operon